jgi:hypothetical protein
VSVALDPDLEELLDECDDADAFDDDRAGVQPDDTDLEQAPADPARRHLRANPKFRDWLRDADERVASIERSFSDDDA